MASAKSNKRQLRSAARFFAVQALFQMEASDTDLDQVVEEFETHRIGAEVDGEQYVEADTGYFRELIEIAVREQSKIDKLTDRALVEKWPIGRIDPTLRSLFRAAGAELIEAAVPPKVVIKEFVDITAAFFPEGREPKFVNAVLDHMAREANPAEFG